MAAEFPKSDTVPAGRVTMKHLASMLGLSQTAVSLGLRDSPQIPAKRRNEIKALAQRMGYTPNAAATSLALFKRSSRAVPVQAAVAWINPLPEPRRLRSYKEFDGYWQGASECLEKFGFKLEEFVLNSDMPAKRIEKILLTRHMQGILIPPVGPLEVDWKDFSWDRFSVIRFGRTNAAPRCHFVTSAQSANAMLAFDRIRERGYRRIGFVGEYYRHITFGAGFEWVKLETGDASRVRPLLVEQGVKQLDVAALKKWMKEEKPDAIFTSLTSLPDTLAKAGYRVPEDVGLAATTVLDVPVSAGIDQRPREIGRVAALSMLSLIHDNEQGLPRNRREILVQGEWVDGPSLPARAGRGRANE